MKNLSLPQPLATWLTTGVWKAFLFPLIPQHDANRVIHKEHSDGKVRPLSYTQNLVQKTEQQICRRKGTPSNAKRQKDRDETSWIANLTIQD